MAASDSSAPFVLSNGIQKSFKDDREYRHIELGNKLRVMLVSDASADKASAAMCVKVGHFSDPEEFPGLAHFCEHMLFLGTEKYPDENSYSAYLNKHGGWSNAYTASEDTNYFFELQHDYLEEALDRFAQFFIAPLFTESCVAREMNAVNSENTKNLQNDMWRLYQLSKSTSKPDHAYHKFGTGNLVTLKERPEAAGLNTRDALLKFHEEFYSANVMRLAIVGRDSLDQLEAWAREKFAAIRNTDRNPPKFPSDPIGAEQLQRKAVVVPVKDARKLCIEWPMPAVQGDYRSKPDHYVSHLLGHEGPGSLLSLLKARNLATELSAGASENDSSFSIFGVTITLTVQGLEQVDEVVTATMQYAAMLRREGPRRWVWEECQAASAMAFRYKSKESPGHYATSLARQMHVHAPEHSLSGPSLYFEYDEASIARLLNCLTVENMRLVVVSKAFEGQTDAEEEWYSTPYKMTPFTAEQRAAWGRALALDDALHLPAPNEFIATDFSLRYPEGEEAKTSAASEAADDAAASAAGAGAGAGAGAVREAVLLGLPVPEVITPAVVREDDVARLWYLADRQFFRPKVIFSARLRSPVVSQSPRSLALSKVYTKLVKESLNEFAYSATLASLAYGLTSSNSGVSIEVSGFNHKLPVLLAKLADKMATCEFTDDQFERIRDQVEKSFKNFAMEQPYRHCISKLGAMTEQPTWTVEEQLAEMSNITADETRAFARSMFSKTFVESLVYGNATPAGARELLEEFMAPLLSTGSTALHRSQMDAARVVQLPTGIEWVNTSAVPNADETNSSIEVYFQVGPFDPHVQAALSVLANIIKEPAFDQLRTKEQLGYIVHTSTKSQYGVNGLRIIVQSHVKHPNGLDTRIEAFLEAFRATLGALSPVEFDANRKAVAAELLEMPKRPAQVAQPMWYEINLGRYAFSRRQDTAAAIAKLTLDDVVAFYTYYVAPGGAGRRKASAHVVAAAHAAAGADGEAAAAAAAAEGDSGKASAAVAAGDKASEGEGEGAAPVTVDAAPTSTRLSLPDGLKLVNSLASDSPFVGKPATVLVAEARAHAGLSNDDPANPVVDVDDIAAFRRGMPLFGSIERPHGVAVSKL